MSVEDRVKNLVRKDIQAINSYHVPASEGMIKLDAMENPFGWPDEMKAAWLDVIRDSEINRYPSPDAGAVKDGLRKAMGISGDYSILLGNGSDEIIQILMMALGKPGDKVLAPEPGFVMYSMIATFTHLQYQGIPLQENFQLDLPAMLDYIKTEQPVLTFIAQPNNPTGNTFNESDIESILQVAEGIVVVDEAYTVFSDSDALPLLDKYDNLLVMRTVSKLGLAGLRLGLLVGKPVWLNEFDKVRLPYNINVLTQLTAKFALEYYDEFLNQARLLKEQRAQMYERLDAIGGLDVYPSQANFLLVKLASADAKNVFEKLKQEHILVKCLAGGHPLLENCLRITVGKEQENMSLLEAISRNLS